MKRPDAHPRAGVTPARAVGTSGPAVDELATAVLTASRTLIAVSARSLAAVEETVTLPQFRTLVVLDNHKGSNLNRLADELDVNASTAMRMVDRLITAGLVTRSENPANRREVVLDLTLAGHELVSTVTRRRRSEIARIVRAIPDEQRTALVGALRAFAEAAGEPVAHDGAAATDW